MKKSCLYFSELKTGPHKSYSEIVFRHFILDFNEACSAPISILTLCAKKLRMFFEWYRRYIDGITFLIVFARPI